ncbi:hypothetical protein [Chengkuizengella sediminis]|uniref:hypothetical protein n=1 Tax=Chengkuizengella sediminis TaxID=1885917 RepID=UPI00138963B8|nr:hypothetical protein [Chengkuizengella sediminis]NDI35247.1 hypothetical protein [Chengkuizengella sediminis]
MTLSLLFVISSIVLFTLFLFYYIFTKRKHISCMTGMMIAMTVGMMVGLLSGVILGIMFSELFIATLLGMIVGMIAGYLLGSPISIMAVLDGILSGLMGGMMGAMLGGMISPNYYNSIVSVFFIIFVGIFLILIYMVQQETKASIEGFIKRAFHHPLWIAAMFFTFFYILNQIGPFFLG